MQEPVFPQPVPESMGSAVPAAQDPDQETMARLRRGGQAALASEFLRHQHRLRRMIEVRLDRRLAGQINPSEILEEAFLEAVSRLDQYLVQPPMPLFLWLRYLTGERILAAHRRLLGQEAEGSVGQTQPGEPSARPKADSASLSIHLAAQLCRTARTPPGQELSARLEQILAQLEPSEREILALRHFEQLTNQEAAEELGISPATASHRYIQALEKLAALLKTLPGFSKGILEL